MTYKLGEFLRSLRGKESLRSVSERSNNKLSHSYISDIEKYTLGIVRYINLEGSESFHSFYCIQ